MAQVIPDEVLKNTTLIKDLADVAKDAALMQGVLMRIKEAPDSSEVRSSHLLSTCTLHGGVVFISSGL